MTKIYRVRTISCDGGRRGRTWTESFFFEQTDAEDYLEKLIRESDERNPKYPYKSEPENVDDLVGFCNWQFGDMVVLDYISVKPQRRNQVEQ